MKVSKCVCDICGADNANHYRIPMYRTFDSTDGKTFYNSPQLVVGDIDLCARCALESTNIHSIGVMCEEYQIYPNPIIIKQ